MATAEQIRANRENAKKSTGPRRTEATRFNGLKHGLRAEQVILPGESRDEFEAERRRGSTTGGRRPTPAPCSSSGPPSPRGGSAAPALRGRPAPGGRRRRRPRVRPPAASSSPPRPTSCRSTRPTPCRGSAPTPPVSTISSTSGSGWPRPSTRAGPPGRTTTTACSTCWATPPGRPRPARRPTPRSPSWRPRPRRRRGVARASAASGRRNCGRSGREYWDPAAYRQRLIDAAVAPTSKEAQLIHRYEMAHEASLRSALRQLQALERSGADIPEPAEVSEAAVAASEGKGTAEYNDTSLISENACEKLASVGAAAPSGRVARAVRRGARAVSGARSTPPRGCERPRIGAEIRTFR